MSRFDLISLDTVQVCASEWFDIESWFKTVLFEVIVGCYVDVSPLDCGHIGNIMLMLEHRSLLHLYLRLVRSPSS